MANNTETIWKDRRGRMRLTIIRKPGQHGPQYSSIVFRSYNQGDDENGKPQFSDTHWMDERDILHAKKLHDIADDVIAETKRIEAENKQKEAA